MRRLRVRAERPVEHDVFRRPPDRAGDVRWVNGDRVRAVGCHRLFLQIFLDVGPLEVNRFDGIDGLLFRYAISFSGATDLLVFIGADPVAIRLAGLALVVCHVFPLSVG
jgi:hypothetical protein